MLRKTLIATIVILALVCGFVLYQKYFGSERLPEGTIETKRKEFSQTPDTPIKPEVDLPPLIKEINKKSAAINSLSCEDLEMKVWQGGHRYRLKGSLHYEKAANFRMEISSIMGKEVDVGSNSKVFWYWSKRDKSPGLHYASHADLNKTRLKTPFNPMFLRSTLGVEELPAKNCKIVENNKDFMLSYPRLNSSGDPIVFSVFVNKERKQIDGYVVVNKDGNTIASCEVQLYEGDVPVKILYNWREENKVMLLELNKPKINIVIAPATWEMPNYTPKINMAEGVQ
jgi:hypothetical protein